MQWSMFETKKLALHSSVPPFKTEEAVTQPSGAVEKNIFSNMI